MSVNAAAAKNELPITGIELFRLTRYCNVAVVASSYSTKMAIN